MGETSSQNREINALSEHKYITNSLQTPGISETRDKFPTELVRKTAGKIQFIPIIEVKPGDQVLSLNEKTGEIEPHMIKGLLDMGVKPVFKLATASGRYIKTTGNHPYLTHEGWVKVADLRVGIEIAVPKLAPNGAHVLPYDGDHKAQKLYPLWRPVSPQQSFPFSFTSFLRIKPETDKHQYKESYDTAETKNSREFSKEITRQSYGKDGFGQVAYKFTDIFLPFVFNLSHQLKNSIQFLSCQAQSFAYAETQPSYTGILWDRIVSITFAGYEQVYDIEVEGTHNFVAGHWVEREAGSEPRGLSWGRVRRTWLGHAQEDIAGGLGITPADRLSRIHPSQPAIQQPSQRTNDRHLGSNTEWRKVVDLKIGDEIAVAREEKLSAVDFSAVPNLSNKDMVNFPVENNAVIPDLESIRSRRAADYPFSEYKRIRLLEIMFNFMNYSLLDAFGQAQKHTFGLVCKVIRNHLMPAFFLTSLPDTRPDLRDISKEARNSGLELSTSSSISSIVSLSNTMPRVLPLLSTNRTMPLSKRDSLTHWDGFKKRIFSSASPFNNGTIIFMPPFEDIYHGLEILSSEFLVKDAYAQQMVNPISPSDILWSRIVAIDFAGYEQVYDIEVEGTHNFVAGHWVEREAGAEPRGLSWGRVRRTWLGQTQEDLAGRLEGWKKSERQWRSSACRNYTPGDC